jgi:uncharacterized protein (TIGR02118 family)
MKFVWFVISSTTPDEFESRWARIPDRWTPGAGLRRWVRSLAVRGKSPFFGESSAFAAVEELWLDPAAIDDVRAVMASIDDGLGAAMSGIARPDRSILYLVEDTTVIDGPECIGPPGIRQFSLAQRRDGIGHEEYVLHWRYVHGPLVRNSPALSRYTQNRVVREINARAEYDGFSELSFTDMQAVARFCESEAYLGEQIREDAPKFVNLKTVLPTMIDRQWEVWTLST